MSTKETLIKKLKEKNVRVGILGLGYVGLPLAVVFGEAGFKVTGIDPDSRKVEALNQGISYIPDVKTGAVERLVKSGHLTATTDFAALQGDGCRQHLCAYPSAPERRTRICPSSSPDTDEAGEAHAQWHGHRARVDYLSGNTREVCSQAGNKTAVVGRLVCLPRSVTAEDDTYTQVWRIEPGIRSVRPPPTVLPQNVFPTSITGTMNSPGCDTKC